MASAESADPGDVLHGESDKARSSKFRFKSKRDREGRSESSYRGSQRRKEHSPYRSSRHKHHKKQRKEYSKPLNDDPSQYDDSYAHNASSSQNLDPETAFRESLFDALADDEGAAFWEGVYGQPIHTYPNVKPGPQGELERMTEAEYAEYVRAKMWEKSHEHIVEERKRREEERQRRKAAREKEEESYESVDDNRELFEEKIAASLRRGEQRKAQKRWQDAWKRYMDGWEKFTTTTATRSNEEGSLAGKAGRGIIPWPVESGKWKEAQKEDIENFFRSAPPADDDFAAILKVERVRWHPDKMQQRFGKNKLDEETVKTITAVFQVVDRLWTERKGKR
jgi:hypothetical protein